MSSHKIKFGDKEVNKKKFYSSKQAILLEFLRNFCGYINNGVIQPLCVIFTSNEWIY